MLAPYGQSLALLTDLYQLTMACGYWREGIADREAVFHHYFRRAPFDGAFAVAAGLRMALKWLDEFRFRKDDLDYLAGLGSADGRPLFESGFLDYLAEFTFRCDMDAVPEGTVVFAQEPLARVHGPLLHCQLAETALLNIVNFQTLVATKAARVCLAAGDSPVLEFGLRRAPGIDGGLSASRAAYIGGCAATSNVLAGKLYGIPVRGTHSHSWVLAFDSELDAFDSFARAMPHNCVLLVDTFDSLQGVVRAIEVGLRLRKQGVRLAGIRLDSGDLADLSARARKLLDAAGLETTAIVASSDLDEYAISALKEKGAQVGVWGVGTSIAAAKGESALGGVYKLSLLKDASGNWQDKVKRSEDLLKASTPGMLQVRRFIDQHGRLTDIIYDEMDAPQGRWSGRSLPDGRGKTLIDPDTVYEDLLRPVLREGQQVGDIEELGAARRRCKRQLATLPGECLNTGDREPPPACMETDLFSRRQRLLASVTGTQS